MSRQPGQVPLCSHPLGFLASPHAGGDLQKAGRLNDHRILLLWSTADRGWQGAGRLSMHLTLLTV